MQLTKFRLTHLSLMILTLVLALGGITTARTVYVDKNAVGRNTGSSWKDAYPSLRLALVSALSATDKPIEMRVAQGIYKPANSSNTAEKKRLSSFQLSNGVRLKGGYAGLKGSDPNERDMVKYRTILSGDHNNDDVPVTRADDLFHLPNRQDNSRVVVKCGRIDESVDQTTLLEGVTIVGGYHNSAGREAPTGGAGLYNYKASLTVRDCTFIDNYVVDSGGAVYNYGQFPIGPGPVFIRCTFRGNYARDGGAMYNRQSNPRLVDCTFINNYAEYEGGAIKSQANSTAVIEHCHFFGNVAVRDGGAFYNLGSGTWAALSGCILVGNYARKGSCLFNDLDSLSRLNHCILWGNHDPALAAELRGRIEVSYSDIQGSFPGEGNIDADPLFIRSGYWADPYDPNMPDDPSDPNAVWIDGDYHLKSQAGRWDPVSESWVRDDKTSPCIDAGDPNAPIGLEPFPNGGIVNVGAYGGTAEASKSYFGEPVCETIIAGDINGDCKVDFLDLAILGRHWLQEYAR